MAGKHESSPSPESFPRLVTLIGNYVDGGRIIAHAGQTIRVASQQELEALVHAGALEQ